MGTFSAILHSLGIGKGKYKKYQGTFVVEKPFDFLTEQFEKKIIGGMASGFYGSSWKFQNAVRVDENTHLFTLTLPIEAQRKLKNFDPTNLRLNDEFHFRRIDKTKTEVSITVHNNTTYDADYNFEELKKFICNKL